MQHTARKSKFWTFFYIGVAVFGIQAVVRMCIDNGDGDAEDRREQSLEVLEAYFDARMNGTTAGKYWCNPAAEEGAEAILAEYRVGKVWSEKTDKAGELPLWYAFAVQTRFADQFGNIGFPDQYIFYVKKMPDDTWKLFGVSEPESAAMWESMKASGSLLSVGLDYKECGFPERPAQGAVANAANSESNSVTSSPEPSPSVESQKPSENPSAVMSNEEKEFLENRVHTSDIINESNVQEAPSSSGAPAEQLDVRPDPVKVPSREDKSSDRPYVIIAASVKQSLSNGKNRAESTAKKIRDAGFENAKVYDGRGFPNFKCCFWVVIVDAYETSAQAVELSDEVKDAGFECYVKNAFEK